MDVLSLLIKPASGKCNLDCYYCFYNDLIKEKQNQVFKVMNKLTSENLIKEAFIYMPKNLILSFQGGEPLLAGLAYYQEIINLVKQYNKDNINVIYSIQTNGVLLSKEWCRFFKQHNFLIGISLDGKRSVNDQARLSHKQSSFTEVMRGINLLKEFALDFNILTVVTKENYLYAKETYHFFKKNGLSFLQFIPCVPLFNEELNHQYLLSNDEYFIFIDSLFNEWSQDIITSDAVSIRYFDNLIALLMGLRANSCDLNNTCGCSLVVEANGDIYPCDFYVYQDYYLGNINECSFSNINNSIILTEFRKNSLPYNECWECENQLVCFGGCQKYRKGQYIYCEATKKFINKYKDELIKIKNILLARY